VESLSFLTSSYDLVVYDLASASPVVVLTGARILRSVQGRIRQFLADGVEFSLFKPQDVHLMRGETDQKPKGISLW